MTLTIEMIEGSYPLPNYSKQPVVPHFETSEQDCSLDEIYNTVREFDKKFNSTDPDFWKSRSIFHMMSAPLLDRMVFLPANQEEFQVLILRKIDRPKESSYKPIHIFENISNETALDFSLAFILDSATREQLRHTLVPFLVDKMSTGVCISFRDTKDQLYTVGWLKA